MEKMNGRIITIGDTFRTIQEAMRCFGKETVNGPKPCLYHFDSTDIAIWFPLSPVLNDDGLYVPRRDKKWLNILCKDEHDEETDLTEVWVTPEIDDKYPNDPYCIRAVFMGYENDGKSKYVFKGVFIRIFGSADNRSHIFRRIDKNIHTALFTNFIEKSHDCYGMVDE